jgi:hypothetical protein
MSAREAPGAEGSDWHCQPFETACLWSPTGAPFRSAWPAPVEPGMPAGACGPVIMLAQVRSALPTGEPAGLDPREPASLAPAYGGFPVGFGAASLNNALLAKLA